MRLAPNNLGPPLPFPQHAAGLEREFSSAEAMLPVAPDGRGRAPKAPQFALILTSLKREAGVRPDAGDPRAAVERLAAALLLPGHAIDELRHVLRFLALHEVGGHHALSEAGRL